MSDDLRAENADLRRRLDTALHAGEMERARMASLLGATTDLLNQLAVLRHPDPSTLWRLGGSPLENAYQELKHSAEAVRPQADALLSRLNQAEGKAVTLEAQLGGWEAACAAQILAIKRALPYLVAQHDSQADMLIEDLTIAIDTNVGETLLARLADLSRQIGEQNTTIGYQDAMLARLRSALDQIDRHVVGACANDVSDMPDPCEECGEMREIAHQALEATKVTNA